MAGLARPHARVEVSEHPDGMPHTQSTIRKMGELALAGAQSYPIRSLATRIAHDVPGKDYLAEVRALYIWVREHVRYRKDPVGIEWLQTPERTIAERAGDCDDIATLIAALAGALGHEFRFRTVGPTNVRQSHITAEVLVRGQWVTLDPVMEPMRPSTALSLHTGAFGQTPSAPTTLLWSSTGEPMQALGFYPNEALRTLWQWQPYFPNASHGAHRPDLPTADDRYRSAGAPGPGQLSGLGCCYAGADRAWAEQAARRGAVSAATLQRWAQRGVMGDEPVVLVLDEAEVDTSNVDGLGGHPYQLGSIWGSLKKIGKGIVKGAKGAVRTVGKVVKAVGKSPVGKVVAPVLALNVDPKLKKIRDTVLRQVPGGGALLKAGKTAERAAASFARKAPAPIVRKAVRPAAAKVVKLRSVAKRPTLRLPSVHKVVRTAAAKVAKQRPADWKAPHPALRRKYPAHAQQTYDARAGVFRVYVPRGRAGLHGLVPTFTLTMGAAQSSAGDELAAYIARMRAAATAAANAVSKFIKSRADKRPPGKSLPEVLAFQQADLGRPFGGTPLKTDGLWGSNTIAAASYYTNMPAAKLPPMLPALRTALTWSPPVLNVHPAAAAPAPAAVRAAAPAPVAPAPVMTTRPTPAPIARPAAAPAAPSSPAAPAGLVEVGQETSNPGFPPVGAPVAAAPAMGPAQAVPPAPGLTLPVTSTVAPLPITPPSAFAPSSVMQLPPPAPSYAQAPSAFAPTSAPSSAPFMPSPPLPAGPGFAPGPTLPSEAGQGGGGDGSWVPWLLAAYCVSKRRQS